MDGITPERLGNLHLVFLHLPIGFVVAAVLLELWRWQRPSEEGAWLQGRLLAANAVAALLAAAAGLVLASAGSYNGDTLELHRWSGVACAGFSIAAWLAHGGRRPWLSRAVLASLLAVTIFAGHQGATLTHGKSVTAWWGGAEEPAEKTPGALVMAGGITPATNDSVFAIQIQPVLERSCFECHGPEKSRGRLRLDRREFAIAGGKSGVPAITPGHPETSELLRRVKLPVEHEDFMPGGDAEPLSAAEIAALEKWIADGAVWR